MTTQTPEQIALDLYTVTFGEKAAKRNAARIAKLATIIQSYGPTKIVGISYSWNGEKMELIRQYGEFVLGTTTTNTRGAGNMVVAIPVNDDVQGDTPSAPHMA